MKTDSATVTRRFVTVSALAERSLPYNLQSLNSPDRCYDFWNSIVAAEPDHEPDKENLIVVVLDPRLRPFAWHRVAIGTVNAVTSHPREVLRPVIAAAGYAFLVMHNHPSGKPSPSIQDISFTRRLVDCAALFQICFLDHVIVGCSAREREALFSFSEAGIVPASGHGSENLPESRISGDTPDLAPIRPKSAARVLQRGSGVLQRGSADSPDSHPAENLPGSLISGDAPDLAPMRPKSNAIKKRPLHGVARGIVAGSPPSQAPAAVG